MEVDRIDLGDCLELLRAVPSDSVQVSFADPPFNLDKKYDSPYQDRTGHTEYLRWCEAWMAEMVRVTKPGGSIFVHHVPRSLLDFSRFLDTVAEFRHWIAWDAPAGPMGKSLQPFHYGILYYSKGPQPKFYQIRHAHPYCIRCKRISKDWGGKKHKIPLFGSLTSDCWTDIFRVKHGQQQEWNHPCILPVQLLERLILMSSDEGDVVLDPFAGTGTSAVAAKRLGRRYIGFELSPNYHQLACRRVAEEDFVSRIGDRWVSYFRDDVLTVRDCDLEALMPHFDVPEDRRELDRKKLALKVPLRDAKKSRLRKVQRV